MTDSQKKVEVRFGAFACTIEGYDDPVAQMREVLGMMQRMISETPALAEASDFSAEQVQDALKDGDAPSPGVVVIRSAETTQEQAEPEQAGDAADEAVEVAQDTVDTAANVVETAQDDVTDTASRFTETANDDAVDAGDALSAAAATATALGAGAIARDIPSSDDAPVEPVQEGPESDEAAAEDTAAEDTAADEPVEADSISDDARPAVPVDETASKVEEPASATAAWLAAQRARAKAAEDAAAAATLQEIETPVAEAPVEPELESEQVSEPIAAEPAISAEAEPEDEDVPFNIFAAPPSPDPVEPLIETARAEVPADAAATLEEPAAETDQAVEIISDEIVQEVSMPVADVPVEPVQEEFVPSAPDPALNIFADASQPDPVMDEPELLPEPGSDQETAPDPFQSAGTQQEEPAPVNIFASATPVMESTADDVVNEPEAPAYTPDAQAFGSETQDFSSEPEPRTNTSEPVVPPEAAPQANTPEPAAPKPAEPSGFNIFARTETTAPSPDPAAPPEEPAQGMVPPSEATPESQPEPEPEPAPARDSVRGAFSALLKRVQGGATMSAPGENTAPPPPPPVTDQNVTAADLVEKAGATQVTDMLAGSAAWLTLVQGKARFTRREVMEIFDTIPGDHPKTLEARIKGFGKLVRSGTLILIDDGVFAMAQNDRDRFRQYLG